MTLLTVLVNERAASTAATASVASYWWLSYLQPYSEVAAALLPLIGLFYWLARVGHWLYKRFKKDT